MKQFSSEPQPADTSAGSSDADGKTNELDGPELEMLADKIINLMKRELILDNEREGRKP